jgi:hypothetical protein
LSVSLSPAPPILVGGKTTATATVSPKAPARTIRFDITSGNAHVTTAVTKLAAPVLPLATVIVVTDFTGFIGGEPINIDGVGHEHLTLAAGPVTSTTLTLATPVVSAHAALSVVTTASALSDPLTGLATANVTAGLTPATEQLTVTDVTDPLVAPVVTSFDQVVPVTLTQTQRFVNAVYADLLNRLPNPADLAFWSGSIDAAGGSAAARIAFVSAVATSAEYRSDVIGGAGTSFYLAYLGRPSDAAGVAFWAAQMASGLTFEQVRLAFVGSPEYFIHHNSDPSQTIDALYNDVLGRSDATDPAGKAYWMANFNVNTIAGQFLFSYEGRQVLVSGYYQSILHRAADLAGASFWTLQILLNGASDENIFEQLLSSPEFLAGV